ncbi:uncharacterized protein LOC135196324 [Macrobrachium nipponense]|uniref:uncharacterized protein LOC135196324 n=1 Tax=Macrobrachium nipponense TaxID=159736 RepID=UPI0030C879D1
MGLSGNICIIFGWALVALLQISSVSCGTSTIVCTEVGRFPHPSDCGRYVDCIPSDTKEHFLVNEGHCHGFPYSASLRRCVSNEEEPGCTPKVGRKRRGVSFPDEEYNFLCTDDMSKTGCYNCQLKYECIGGQAFVEFCSTGSTCSDNADFGGGVCLPYAVTAADGRCKCDKIGVMPDSYNDDYFVFCDTNADPPKVQNYKCPDGQKFNPEVNTCQDVPPEPCSQEPVFPPCGSKIETRVNPNDCAWSYTCIPGYDVIPACCTGRQYYDESSGLCKDICEYVPDSGSSEPECGTAGRMANQNDCTKYHVCLPGVKEPYESKSCPEGTYFKDTVCVPGPLPEDCFTFSYSDCPGYEEFKGTCLNT